MSQTLANPQTDGKDHEFLIRRVLHAAHHGQRQIAMELLQEILREEPNSERALLLASELAATRAEGIAFLERAVAANPGCMEAINALAIKRMGLAESAAAVAEAPPVEERARTAAWQCPLCLHTSNSSQNSRCSRCGSVLAAENLQLIAANRGVNEALVESALERWLEIAERVPSGEAYLNVARAYLNLHRSAEASPYLRKASRWEKEAPALKLAADTIDRRKLIVAADDSRTFRKILQIILDRAGYRVIIVPDGMEALTAVATWSPALVLLDITMPKMNGYQVCKAIRSSAHASTVPVIFLSGNDGFFDHLKGTMAGAEDYISKPIDEAELLKAVAKRIAAAE